MPTPARSPTATPPAAPSAPSALVATASGRQVTLSWTDTAAAEAGFAIERSSAGSPFAEIARVGADATAFTESGLAANTVYRYRVRAFNAAGYSAYSDTARVRTPRQ
jgi:titin